MLTKRLFIFPVSKCILWQPAVVMTDRKWHHRLTSGFPSIGSCGDLAPITSPPTYHTSPSSVYLPEYVICLLHTFICCLPVLRCESPLSNQKPSPLVVEDPVLDADEYTLFASCGCIYCIFIILFYYIYYIWFAPLSVPLFSLRLSMQIPLHFWADGSTGFHYL